MLLLAAACDALLRPPGCAPAARTHRAARHAAVAAIFPSDLSFEDVRDGQDRAAAAAKASAQVPSEQLQEEIQAIEGDALAMDPGMVCMQSAGLQDSTLEEVLGGGDAMEEDDEMEEDEEGKVEMAL